MAAGDAASALAASHRSAWGRLLAALAGQVRSLDVAEEALADAFAAAAERWPADGVPSRPDSWLYTTARRKAIDRMRRESNLARKLPLLVVPGPVPGEDAEIGDAEADTMSTIPDERLRLLFTCCHPAIAADARVALTLRLLGGLTTTEVARAFLVSESTMAARVTRAKKKIAAAGVPYREPTDAELPDRLPAVLAVLYLVFNEGYAATSGDRTLRVEMCERAMSLTAVLAERMPDEPEVLGLHALMLLQHARRNARFDADGQVVLLPDQDRGRWDSDAVSQGLSLVARAGRRAAAWPGPYLLQAAVAAEHGKAGRADDTNWRVIAALYARLEEITGSPVVRLNRAVAVAEVDGPQAGLDLIADLDDALPRYHLLPAARADLHRRLGQWADAAECYAAALELAGTDTDRRFLAGRLAEASAEAAKAATRADPEEFPPNGQERRSST